jgi:hypothetical protein
MIYYKLNRIQMSCQLNKFEYKMYYISEELQSVEWTSKL